MEVEPTGQNGIDLRKKIVVHISKTKPDRAMVTIKQEREVIGCLSFAVVASRPIAYNHREKNEMASRDFGHQCLIN